MLDGVLGYKFLWFILQANQQLGLPEVFDSKMTCLLTSRLHNFFCKPTLELTGRRIAKGRVEDR